MNELFKAAVEREIKKRESAYPKIIAKMKKKGEDELAIRLTENQHGRSIYYTQLVLNWVQTGSLDGHNAQAIFEELKREYRMRLKYYPRWMFLKRMDDFTAMAELAVWRSLCEEYARVSFGQHQDTYIALLDKK